jgi:hypothetical protein
MLTREELRRIARTRFREAEILFRGRRYDGAVYLCGYAIELSLKARICRTLRWVGFPETRREFEDYASFKTHKLEVLLHLAGLDNIKTRYLADWSIVVQWEPEARYRRAGAATQSDAKSMIDSTRILMGAI